MTTKGRTDFYKPPSKAEQEFLYSGKSPGMTFEAFDECVISWARNKYGERFGKALWRDEMVDLEKLDLDDELGKSIHFRGLLQSGVRGCTNRFTKVGGTTGGNA